MAIEFLDINGAEVPHTIVPMKADGSCLFRSISYIMYGTQLMAREVREMIVDFVIDHWDEFQVMSHNKNGDNYANCIEYRTDMSLPSTYGGLCELTAAGQIFNYIFEVYHNGKLYESFGAEDQVIGKLRFTGDFSSGHFDVYLPFELEENFVFEQNYIAPSLENLFKKDESIETLYINGSEVAHIVVRMKEDGSCLFSSISYILYGTELMAREVRELIVNFVIDNWDEFQVMSHNKNGDNYANCIEYRTDMSLPSTYGGLCELSAASRIFNSIFEVYRDGKLYESFGDEDQVIGKLRFTGDYSSGHFDVYLLYQDKNGNQPLCYFPQYNNIEYNDENELLSNTNNKITNVNRANRRSRFRNEKRILQMRQINKNNRHKKYLWKVKFLSGTTYDPRIDYASDQIACIGKMIHKCTYCHALKWKDETPGMCCSNGKVKLSSFEPLPELLSSLLLNHHQHHQHFMDHIRQYNGCFQMTSFGAERIVEGGFMPTFKIQGQVYHLVGSLLPEHENDEKFLQIYFVGEDEREADLRCKNFPNTKKGLVIQLQKMLHEVNVYVRDFKIAFDNITTPSRNFKVIINADKTPANAHKGRYNAPTVNEVAVLIVGQEFTKRDIIIESHDNKLHRISEIHRSYDALQYPLLFCRGENGYSTNIPQIDPKTKMFVEKTVSAAQFYSYRLMIREGEDNHMLYFRSLLSQFLVDMYAKIETERLNYIKFHQKKLRADNYIHLQDAVRRQDADAAQLGQMVILPSSFTGGPRYMHERIQDALTYVRHGGCPDLFITFTCNPQWDEIKSNLFPGQRSHDRHDIIARVFRLKVKKMMDLFVKSQIYGGVKYRMYSVEWQKRGLPHIHLLLWLMKRISPDMIDKFVCCEIPDPEKDPLLYDIVKSTMIHGPCGTINPNAPCMKDGKCTKRYPRPFVKETQTGEDGYPLYRRRSPADGGFTVEINGLELDNRWVVPYPPILLKIFKAHINIEICTSVKSIKYICKYINKGTDQAAFVLQNERNEVLIFQSGRYISSSEAIWRILEFPIHERYPTVFHLAVHLENGQRIYFDSENLIEKLNNPPKTTLTAFFDLCKNDNFAKTLLYCEVPSYYRWLDNKFVRRKRGSAVNGWPGVVKDDALGRVYTIHPNNAECFYLRILLHQVRGPTSFSDLKTFNGITYPTYQASCRIRGLLEDDQHWDVTLQEGTLCDSPSKLRNLFAVMLVFCQLSDPLLLWEKYKNSFSEDMIRRMATNIQNAPYYIDNIYNECLIIIENITLDLAGKKLQEFGLPSPKTVDTGINRDYIRETNYDVVALREFVQQNKVLLTSEQSSIYEAITKSVDSNSGQFFFLDAPGGTGKTFLLNLLLAEVRSNGGIALAAASSGIAATLLKGGKTAHAAFKLPLNLNNIENPLCYISKQSNLATVFRDCKLIVWDESTMAHKGAFEALDRSLRDIRDNNNIMGGVTVLLAGDFRQTLPVIPRGTRADEIKACLKKSYLWHYISNLSLTKNMRVHLHCDENASRFSELLLKIGNGECTESDGKIELSPDLCSVVTMLDDLTEAVYPDLSNIKEKSADWLCERAILTPTNDKAAEINSILLEKFDAVQIEYKSIDSVIEMDDAVQYPLEVLNSLNPPGFPPHQLIIKIGTPIMLLRNLCPPKLCNGTRLQVTVLHKNLIEAIVLTGCAQGESVFIPRIPLIPTDSVINFRRLQFPIKVCFAMTINKAQGQTLKVAGIDLRDGCFSHGQFYVACSRVSSSNSLFILAPQGRTANIVYKEIL